MHFDEEVIHEVPINDDGEGIRYNPKNAKIQLILLDISPSGKTAKFKVKFGYDILVEKL